MSASYQFDPMSAADLPMLRSWLAAPHVAQWWREPEVEVGYVRDMIEGRDTTRPFIFSVDGEPAGYIQYWFIGHHQNETWIADHPWLAELPSDAIGVDLSIGDASKLSKTIIIDPDPINHRAVRAYEKAGYRAIPRLQGRTGDTLIMQYELTSSDPHRASTP